MILKTYERTSDMEVFENEEEIEDIYFNKGNLSAEKTIGVLHIDAVEDFKQYAIVTNNGKEEKIGYFSPYGLEIWIPINTEGLFESKYDAAKKFAKEDLNNESKNSSDIIRRQYEIIDNLLGIVGWQ